jgi:hypothetical protein
VQSRISSDAASFSGQWVVENYRPEDWQYVMYMPALYTLVSPDGQNHDMMLTEEYNSSESGYVYSAHARLSLSFQTKVPGFLGLAGQQKLVIPSQLLLGTVTGNLFGLRDFSGIWWRKSSGPWKLQHPRG